MNSGGDECLTLRASFVCLVGAYVVEEIADLDHAFALLMTQPQQKRDVAQQAALTACERANANLMSLETLRENIRRFLEGLVFSKRQVFCGFLFDRCAGQKLST